MNQRPRAIFGPCESEARLRSTLVPRAERKQKDFPPLGRVQPFEKSRSGVKKGSKRKDWGGKGGRTGRKNPFSIPCLMSVPTIYGYRSFRQERPVLTVCNF